MNWPKTRLWPLNRRCDRLHPGKRLAPARAPRHGADAGASDASREPCGYAEAKPNVVLPLPNSKPRLRPALVEEVVVSVLSTTSVELTWKAPADPSVVGYHVERAVVKVLTEDQLQRLKRNTPPLAEPSVGALGGIDAFQRLTSEPVKETTFVDTAVDLAKPRPPEDELIYARRFSHEELDAAGKPYRFSVFAYRIRALNVTGVESFTGLFHPPFISAVALHREDGPTCHLKWIVNPNAAEYRRLRFHSRSTLWTATVTYGSAKKPISGLLLGLLHLHRRIESRPRHSASIHCSRRRNWPTGSLPYSFEGCDRKASAAEGFAILA